MRKFVPTKRPRHGAGYLKITNASSENANNKV